MNAFKEACTSPERNKVVIPKSTYMLSQVTLQGPCKAPIEIHVQGTVQATKDSKAFVGLDHWIAFQNINGFTLSGSGTFDGQGESAWDINNCHKTQHCVKLPIVSFSPVVVLVSFFIFFFSSFFLNRA